jgi:hypothetical protein
LNETSAATTWQSRLPFYYGWVIVAIALFTTFFGIGLTWVASTLAIPMKDRTWTSATGSASWRWRAD